jgi:putative ABC transport system substrate-binding protein
VKKFFLITLLALSSWTGSIAWGAAQPGREYRIGYLALAPIAETPSPERAAFLRAMERRGYVQGKNLVIVYGSAESNIEMLPGAAADLVDQKPNLIVAAGTATALAAKKATRTIPIVMFGADAVANGIVASLGKPGANVTGVSSVQFKLGPKRLEILKEAVPRASAVAVLYSQVHPAHIHELKAIEARARELGLVSQPIDVTRLEDLQAAFARMGERRPDAVMVLADYRTMLYRRFIAEFAINKRLPTMFGSRDQVYAGGLMSYGQDRAELFARIAHIADRILNGADPRTLPVEQPARFELVINLRTAHSLEFTIPEPVLMRANLLVE